MNNLEQLHEALSHPHKSVRRDAAETLGRLGESALDTLISAFPTLTTIPVGELSKR